MVKRRSNSDAKRQGIAALANYENCKPLLSKVMVISENVRDSFGATEVHRNAVREAVGFVGAATVEFDARAKRFVRLRDNGNARSALNLIQ